jgi:hypothetical protein
LSLKPWCIISCLYSHLSLSSPSATASVHQWHPHSCHSPGTDAAAAHSTVAPMWCAHVASGRLQRSASLVRAYAWRAWCVRRVALRGISGPRASAGGAVVSLRNPTPRARVARLGRPGQRFVGGPRHASAQSSLRRKGATTAPRCSHCDCASARWPRRIGDTVGVCAAGAFLTNI